MKSALLLIDIQNDYFDGGRNPLYEAYKTGKIAKEILEKFREKNLPVVHIQHVSVRPGAGFFIEGTEGVGIHELVKPLQNEKVIIKNYPNSFRDTGLLDYLKLNNVEELIVCGMMTHMCVAATVKAAFDYGFRCKIVSEGCTTKALSNKEVTVDAQTVHAVILASLSGVFAEIVSSEEITV